MPSHMRQHLRSGGAAVLAAVLVAASGHARTEEDPMKLDRCNLEMVDCATGPNSSCLIGPNQLDETCMEHCRRAFDACMAGEDRQPKPRPTPTR
jgi:hypothetical protein